MHVVIGKCRGKGSPVLPHTLVRQCLASASDPHGYFTMCCSRIRLPKIARALICLIAVTQLCLFIGNSSSLFDLAKTKIFR